MSSSDLADTQPAGPEDRPLGALPATIGRFAIASRLGEGGMGVVLLATDPLLGRQVAIKVLRGASDDAAQRRLLREAQAMAKLSHENVIVVHEVGTHEAQVYVAMELVTGGTLRQWQAGKRWREIVACYVRAGRGLAAAHAAGRVQRGVKPDNVLVGDDGRVRVTDFGLVSAEGEAKRAPVDDVALTQTGAVMGTPRYMAPEQHLGESVDARADQFAFCVALYEALYGAVPFAGETMAALGERVLAGDVRPVPVASPVPIAVRDAVLRGLSRDRAARFAAMPELLDALAANLARPPRRVWPAVLAAIASLAIGIAIYLAIATRGGDVTVPAHGVRIGYGLASGGPRELERTAAVLRARIARRGVTSYRVAVTGADVVVDLPQMDDESRDQMQQIMMRGARLEIHVADDATDVLQLVAHDPAVATATETWHSETGAPHTDTYLRAADRATLERVTRGLAIPTDHRFAYELAAYLHAWRTYYIVAAPALTGAAIASARTVVEPETERTAIALDLDAVGAQLLATVTAANVGKKLVFLLDDRVESAPVINSAIRGGHIRLSLASSGDSESAQRDAESLAIALESGALPAALVERYITRF